VRRAEACGCSVVVLTLDTTMLGWRPRDLDLGSLLFLRGLGIAQYTSDPSFRRDSGGASPSDELSGKHGPARAPRIALSFQTIAAVLEQKASFPGGLLRNLASGEPRAAVRRFVETYSRPSLRWDDLKFLRQHT
jgi:lactate 2-monooxygenase